MLGVLSDLVEELRAVGVPVSMVETMDAAEALRYVDLADREALRAALGATMVKNERHQHAFHVAFDVFFGLGARPEPPEAADQNEDEQRPGDGAASGMRGGAGGAGSGEDEALFEAIAGALEAGDEELLRTLVAEAVDRYAGDRAGPAGGRPLLLLSRDEASRRSAADAASARRRR